MTTLVSLGALTVAGYRLRTGDNDSAASAVTGALNDAESLMEEELRRFLPLDTRTEALRIFPDGRVYPHGYPITDSPVLQQDGRALLFARADAGAFVGVIDLNPLVTPRMTVTTTGGFDADTLPVTLRDALYDLAQGVILDRVPLPVGAGSMSVGDVSVSITAPGGDGVDAYVTGLSKRVTKYRNRYVG